MTTTARGTSTRERMLWSALALLQERGANALTVDAVLAHSKTPRGSVYHHFPGGREQILAETTRLGSQFVSAMIDQTGSSPVDLIDGIAAFWKDAMLRSDYQTGCTVAAVVIDGHQASEEVDAIAQEAFATWTGQVHDTYVRAGIPSERASLLASITLSLVEGALIQARIRRSLSPLDEAASSLKLLLAQP
ncbi:TetR family transcriptional regulator [Nocardioides baekrokdamisoli]|uniref:TetR family transcriptional regulator n=1 Tax=Nocardioides baekrokdamisoli TaxID=1804624 RepID=A0A3G9IYA7_9ACTN|nr:TetR/AcrR family transcriptional regulator [Nocardioides baekrokdamisoli]BBH15719.1 TetR family transcriptional regulator [Nocardioides baekrokdamisoli]